MFTLGRIRTEPEPNLTPCSEHEVQSSVRIGPPYLGLAGGAAVVEALARGAVEGGFPGQELCGRQGDGEF